MNINSWSTRKPGSPTPRRPSAFRTTIGVTTALCISKVRAQTSAMASFRQSLKLFATDLDGTVLMDRGVEGSHATPRIKAALRALQDSGVVVCLASGRMHESIRAIGAEMGVFGPVISYNGAMLRGPADEIWEQQTLDPALAAEVVAFAESEDLPLNYYLDGVLYARRIQPWWDLYHGRTSSPMRELTSHKALEGSAPFKLLIYACLLYT